MGVPEGARFAIRKGATQKCNGAKTRDHAYWEDDKPDRTTDALQCAVTN